MLLWELFITAAIIAATLALSEFLRSKLLPALIPRGRILNLALEAVATFELCAVAFEHGLLMEYPIYGKALFSLALILICMWRSYKWINVSTSPNAQLEALIDGQISFAAFLEFNAAELLGGFLVYTYYTKPIWSLELSKIHTAKLHGASLGCQAHVQVHYLLGTLIEATCTCVCTLLIRLISSTQRIPERVASVLKSVVITGLVLAALNTTGGYMSPVLATVLQFGCTGVTPFQHIMVYWVSAIGGQLAAKYAWKYVEQSSLLGLAVNNNDRKSK